MVRICDERGREVLAVPAGRLHASRAGVSICVSRAGLVRFDLINAVQRHLDSDTRDQLQFWKFVEHFRKTRVNVYDVHHIASLSGRLKDYVAQNLSQQCLPEGIEEV